MKSLGVDENYLSTYKIELVEGRGFSKDIITDETQAFILNEAAVIKLGWDEPLNKDFGINVHGGGGIDLRSGKVVGVIRDFHYQSLYNAIDPLVIYVNKT